MPTAVARMRAGTLHAWAQNSDDPGYLRAAEQAYGRLLELSPYNVQDTLVWADLAADLGRRDQAVRRYQKVLELREQAYLDPADPLTAEQLERVRAYLDAAEGTGD